MARQKFIVVLLKPSTGQRSRKEFKKPSVQKRLAKEKAIYVQHLRLEEDQ